MQFDLARLPPMDRYELLLSTVVPRPIALITTLSPSGALNAAPYSLFNVLSHDPPLMVVSVLAHPEGRLKDTGQNILATKEFVVNLVSEKLAEAMNLTCIDAPAGVDELGLARLECAQSVKVAPPRIAASPVAYECRLLTSLSFGSNQAIVLGEILTAHVEERYVIDADRCLIDTPNLNFFGAMHGARWYARTTDRFEMERPTWAAWSAAQKA